MNSRYTELGRRSNRPIPDEPRTQSPESQAHSECAEDSIVQFVVTALY